jgi:integrase
MTNHNLPSGALVIYSTKSGEPRYRAKWRDRDGNQQAPTIGPAWLTHNGTGWVKRKGRLGEGYFDEKRATVRMAELIAAQDKTASNKPKRPDATFDDAAAAWLDYVENVKRVKPGTIADYRIMLAQPTTAKRGKGNRKGRIMRGFSGRPLRDITTGDINRFLLALDREGLAARNVNRHRQILHGIFNYATKPDSFGLAFNPVADTEKRREAGPGNVETFTPEELAAISRAASKGAHRPANRKAGTETAAERDRMNKQDAALYMVAALTGLRQSELRALRWCHIDFSGQKLTVEQAVSGDQITTPKSGKIRTVPLADEAVRQLDALSHRQDFTRRDDLVFCRFDGGVLDASALRRRFKAAERAAGVRVRRFHDLRHTFGSRAVLTFNVVEVQALMGHSRLEVTQRYLHAKPRPDDAARIGQAFALDPISPEGVKV